MDKDKLFINCFERASKQNPKINGGERDMELGKTVMLKDENDALRTFETWIPNLWKGNRPLINGSTGEWASNKFIENFKKTMFGESPQWTSFSCI